MFFGLTSPNHVRKSNLIHAVVFCLLPKKIQELLQVEYLRCVEISFLIHWIIQYETKIKLTFVLCAWLSAFPPSTSKTELFSIQIQHQHEFCDCNFMYFIVFKVEQFIYWSVSSTRWWVLGQQGFICVCFASTTHPLGTELFVK